MNKKYLDRNQKPLYAQKIIEKTQKKPVNLSKFQNNASKIPQQFNRINPNTPFIKSDPYRQIRYQNIPQMLIPSDDRQFNYHLTNINSISDRISGLLSFVGTKKSKTDTTSEINQYLEERKKRFMLSQQNQDPLANPVTREIFQKPVLSQIEILSNNPSQTRTFQKSICSRRMRTSPATSRMVSYETPEKDENARKKDSTPIKDLLMSRSQISRLQQSGKKTENSKASQNRKSPKKFEYLSRLQDTNHHKSSLMDKLSRKREQMEEISRKKGYENESMKSNEQEAKKQDISQRFIYTVRQESSNYHSGKDLEQLYSNGKNLAGSLVKSYRKQFKYLEEIQNQQKNADGFRSFSEKPLENQSSNQTHYIQSGSSEREESRQLDESYHENLSQPSPPIQTSRKKKDQFQIKVYPCDLTYENIKQYLADRLLISTLLDISIQQQRIQILGKAYSQYRSGSMADEKKFYRDIESGRLDIIERLKQKVLKGGIVEERRIELVYRQILAVPEVPFASYCRLENVMNDEQQDTVLENFIHNFLMGEKYWNNKLKQIITFNELDNSKFDPMELDLQSKGYLKVEDITCLINLHASSLKQIRQKHEFIHFFPRGTSFADGKKFKNKEVLPMFNRFIKRMKVYYSSSDFGAVSSSDIIANAGISYQCFMDKIL